MREEADGLNKKQRRHLQCLRRQNPEHDGDKIIYLVPYGTTVVHLNMSKYDRSELRMEWENVHDPIIALKLFDMEKVHKALAKNLC